MNEVAARLVAAGVVAMSAAVLLFGLHWLVPVLAYGFVARVLSGPTLSPLGQLVTRGIVPRLRISARPVPGPPKRFAQGIGAVLTVAATIAIYGFGATVVGAALVAVVFAAASFEAFLGFCLGCKVFALLMRVGVIPESVCVRCRDLWGTWPARFANQWEV